MEDGGEVYRVLSEYYFLDYYRVLKVRSGDRFVLSVDVYRRTYPFKPEKELCIDDGKYCILYHYIDPSTTNIGGVEEIRATGIKAGDIVETVNVRWILDHEPPIREIEKIFRESWRVIGCRAPEDPWSDPCG